MQTIGKTRVASLVMSAVLACLGVICWLAPFVGGYDAVNVGSGISWGLYIATFFLLAGTGSGLLMVGGARMVRGRFDARLFAASLGCLVAAGILITFDLFQPWRILNLIFGVNPGSFLFMDFVVLALAFILSLVALFKSGKALGVCLFVIGAAIAFVEGSMLSTSLANELWHTGTMPVLFMVESVVAALAFATVALPEEERPNTLFLVIALAAAGVIQVCDVVTALYFGGTGDAAEAARIMTSGGLGLLFWGQLVVCVVIPALALLVAPSQRLAAVTASVLAGVGVLTSKYALLIAGQSITFDGVIPVYSPSLVEVGGAIGACGLAFLIYFACARLGRARA